MSAFQGHVRDLGSIDEKLLTALRTRIERDEKEWALLDAVKPNGFAVLEGVQHIVFQYPVSLRDHRRSRFYSAWPDWRAVVEPVIDAASQTFSYPNGRTARIMLARLLPGTSIGTHIDGAPAARVPHKIHVPVVSDPSVRFLCEESAYHLEVGHAYEVNNRLRHGGVNPSPVPRVHLIFDYYRGSA